MELKIKMGWSGFDTTVSKQVSCSDFCQHGTGPTVFIKFWTFLEQMKSHWLLSARSFPN